MMDRDTFYRIRYLREQESLNITQIANIVGVSRPTVAKWLREPEFRHSTHTGRRLCEPFMAAIVAGLDRGLCPTYVYRDLAENHGFRGSCSSLKSYVRELGLSSRRDAEFTTRWVLRIIQGDIGCSELDQELRGKLDPKDIQVLHSAVLTRPLRYRNRALAVLAHSADIPQTTIAQCLFISTSKIRNYVRKFEREGAVALVAKGRRNPIKHEQQKYIDAVFGVLHTPPCCYNFNRTTWRMDDLYQTMVEKGLGINRASIRRIIRDAGYQVRKAKVTLTSNDPEYRKKLEEITAILSNLGPDEKFFSIDEFGPFAVKTQGGRALTPPGERRTVPQRQKTKGSLILTGALELSTNQMTHFYSEKKNTGEMIKLLNILLGKSAGQDCIYFSWDAASWHASKELYRRVDEVNGDEYRESHGTPVVKLAPLPSCAQFLNVIESVFSGMAKAIIHNSDYQSVDECKVAVDRYFAERNGHFSLNPKRAGRKIWGEERMPAEFSESNNCKDPMWR